jgi:hypothetical protein
MEIVKRDEIGLYVTADGYIMRPVADTDYREGDKISTYFRADLSVVAGVGKGVACGKNEYLEAWLSTGILSWMKETIPMEYQRTGWEETKKLWSWVKFGKSSTGKWRIKNGESLEI